MRSMAELSDAQPWTSTPVRRHWCCMKTVLPNEGSKHGTRRRRDAMPTDSLRTIHRRVHLHDSRRAQMCAHLPDCARINDTKYVTKSCTLSGGGGGWTLLTDGEDARLPLCECRPTTRAVLALVNFERQLLLTTRDGTACSLSSPLVPNGTTCRRRSRSRTLAVKRNWASTLSSIVVSHCHVADRRSLAISCSFVNGLTNNADPPWL